MNAQKSPSGEMEIMDTSGHTQLKWNVENSKEVATAMAAFDRLVGEGYRAFASRNANEAKRAISEFDPTMEQVVMVPRIIGG